VFFTYHYFQGTHYVSLSLEAIILTCELSVFQSPPAKVGYNQKRYETLLHLGQGKASHPFGRAEDEWYLQRSSLTQEQPQ
jgi:hypothetical protein